MKTTKKLMIPVLVCWLMASCTAAPMVSPSAALVETAQPAETSISTRENAQIETAGPDYWPTREWRSSSPEAQGMDSEQLVRLFEAVGKNHTALHSMLIIRNGYLVTEAYFSPYTAETRHQMQSITKSFLGALVGIAIADGAVRDASQPALDFFPDRAIANLNARKKAITVEDLLTFSSGFACQDFSSSGPSMEQSEDWVQFVLDLPVSAEPGEQWRYCSAQAHLLSAILQQATGMDARTYANERLFRPLGIDEVPVERWGSDPQGVTTGGYGLFLTPGELAKFALLYLMDGRWEGRQIVPAEWVQTSIQQHIQAQKRDYINLPRGYGYLWSTFPDAGVTSALGLAGQHVHLIPELDMAVIFTAAIPQDGIEFNLLRDYILPAVKSVGPLPANPQAEQELAELAADAALPVRPVKPLPATAGAISGKTFKLEPNGMHWDEMTLTFPPASDEGLLQFNDESPLPFGLDNVYRQADGSPVAIRGYWESEQVLMLEGIYVEQGAYVTLRLRFDGDQLKMIYQDRAFFGPTLHLVGTMQK